MRRVGKGGSPEVVVGPCDYSSPCSSAETSFRELDDVFLQTQTRIWLGEVLHVRFDEETSIADLLADGELLFQVSKVVWRMLLKKHAELKYSKVYIHERASFCKSGGRYMAYPKVDSFLRICQILGLTGIDLFSPSDVVEKRDIRRVCMCVRSLSKKARTKDLNVPDFDIVTYTIAMPTYRVGCIRRRLEQSWWSSTNSSGCTPCLDLKEIYRQKSLDSDYMWLHSSCSESDDAEDIYREYELQSPASITSYDDADISSLIEENLPGSGSVAEEHTYPSQNFFTLTWEQDEDMFRGVQSAETYLDTSVHVPRSNTTSNSNLQVTTMCCSKSFPPCRACQAHLDVRTSFSFMEDISWLQTKTNSGTEIHKFDFGHSPVNTSSSRNLASELDSCLTVDAKEEKYEASNSSMSQNDSIAKFLPESYRKLDSKATVVPPSSKKPLTCVTEDHDTIDSTCMLLLDEITKENGRDVLECNNELSECSSAGLLDSLCESRHPEVHSMDTEGKVAWDNHNISGLNAGSYVNKNLMFGSPGPLSGNSDSILQNINNHCSISIESVADDQSWSHIEALNVNLGHLENKTTCEVGNAEVSLIASQNSGNTVTSICEDLSDTAGCLQFPDFQSPEKNSQTDLIDEVTVLKGLLGTVDDEGSSLSTLNEVSLNGNGVDSISGKLCNLSVRTTDLDRGSAVCHESQASATDRDPHISELQNQALIDNNFLGVSHIDSISEELGLSQVSVGCNESNGIYPSRNRHCSQFIDVMQGASDSSTDSRKQFNGFLSRNVDAFAALEEQMMDFCAQIHNRSLSSDSISGVNDSPVEKDLIFKKLVDEDGKIYTSASEDRKQIPMNNFCMNEVERQSRANCLSKTSALDENTKVHQIAVADGKSCSQSMENQMVNNLWMEGFRKQPAGSQHTITEREGTSLVIEPGKTCCPCCRISDEHVKIKQDSFVGPCAENSMNYCAKDKVQHGIDCTYISEVPKEKCLTHNERVPGSLYAEESSVSIIHHLGVNPRETKGSEELYQGKIQNMDFDVLVSASLSVVDFSERQVPAGTWHDHLDQAEACTLKIEGLETTLASNEDCLRTGYLDTNVGSIKLETHSHICSPDSDTTAHCDSVFSTGYPEFRNSYGQREESPCSTACVLDMKNSADQSIEVNYHHQPPMDGGANSMYQNDFACTEALKKVKDVEDGDLRTAVRPDEKKREEAQGLEKPAKKILLKSFAGGMTILGALFLLLHFRRGRDRGNIVTNVVKSQVEKASHERHPDKDKHSRLYPTEKLKF